MIKKILIIIGLVIISISTSTAFANELQEETTGRRIAQEDEFKAPQIPKPPSLPGREDQNTRVALTENVLPKFAVNMVGFVSMFALLFLIIAGVRFVTAYGNEERIESAKRQATYSIVGLLIALLSYTIVSIIVNLRIEGADTPTRTPEVEQQPAQEQPAQPKTREEEMGELENLFGPGRDG